MENGAAYSYSLKLHSNYHLIFFAKLQINHKSARKWFEKRPIGPLKETIKFDHLFFLKANYFYIN